MRTRTQRLLLLLAILCAAAPACTGGRLQKQHAERMTEADALFARGSYVSLRKAFDIYDALRQAAYLPPVTTTKAFETAILLAAREKELGMSAEPWIARAESLKPAGPAPAATRSTVYLDLVRALPWGTGRFDPDQASRMSRGIGPAAAALRKWDDALGPVPARDLVGTYLMAALRCAHSPARELFEMKVEAIAPAFANMPLMKYAVGSCKVAWRKELDALANDADFHEAAFQSGRLRIFDGGPTMYADAKVLHEAAYAGLPDALSNIYQLAVVLGALMDYEGCAAKYDEIAKKGGAARTAMLERTVCLTRGAKRELAITSATDLIDNPGIYRGEGFFWRAWNRYHLKDLARARADVDAAKPLFTSADVFALSGFIAYDQDQKDFSYSELGAAVKLNNEYCIAHFYRGLIDTQKVRWPQAADVYAVATSCYEKSLMNLRKELSDAEALPADDPTRERRIANLTEAIEAERLMTARSMYNTGYSFAQAGDLKLGAYYVERSGKMHKELEKLAQDMLEAIRKQGK